MAESARLPYAGSLLLVENPLGTHDSILFLLDTKTDTQSPDFRHLDLSHLPEMPDVSEEQKQSEAHLLAYPNREPEHVAPDKTHRAMLRHEKAIRHSTTKHGLAVAALTAVGIVGYFAASQDYVSYAVWGVNHAQTEQEGANNFTSDGTGRVALTVGGMGIRDSKPTVAEPLVPALVDAQTNTKLYALQEGFHLNLPDTMHAVDAMLEESPTNHFVIYGMSTGFKEALYIAAHVRKKYPDMRITILADSGPLDQYSAYDLRDNDGLVEFSSLLQRAQLFGDPQLKALADMISYDTRHKYIRDDGTIDHDKVLEELGRIWRDVFSRKGTTNSLRMEQLALIVDDSAESNLDIIATDDPEIARNVNIVYFRPIRRDPDSKAILPNDRVVDSDYVIDKFRDMCAARGMTFSVQNVESWHAGVNDYRDQYNVATIDALRRIDNDYELHLAQQKAREAAEAAKQKQLLNQAAADRPTSTGLIPR